MDESKANSNEPSVNVEARLMRDGESTVIIFIGDAPVAIRQKRMPKTFEKLVAVIEKAGRR
jgi:hypothetical protein